MAMTLIIGVFMLLYGLYCYLVRPLNRVKNLGDLGFFFGHPEPKGKYKEMQIERMKKLRVLGDIPPVFPNGWFRIAETDDLKPKQVLPIVFMGQNLTLFRSENGSVHVINSYCPHLGANFSVGGRVVDNNCIQCPFHGWIFSGETGKCTRIPYSNSDKIPEKATVPVWPVVEVNRHIFIWYHCDGIPPTWEIPQIPEIDTGEWTFRGRTEHDVMCHIQEIPENGADLAHLHYLHIIGINEGCDITKMELSKKPSIRHVWNGSWEPEQEPNKHIGCMYLEHFLTVFGIQVPGTYVKLKAMQIGPGIVHMIFDFGFLGKGIVFQTVTPEDAVHQRVRFVMYAQTTALYAKIFMLSEAYQFERDIYVWTNKRYVKNPLYCKDDGPIAKHRRWFGQFYTDNSPRLNKDGSLTDRPKSLNDVNDW
uniref:cholesterol 7-desaturase n=1 Tax=Acrobeloides nanus TaxID=290746 RepID=A0A914C9P8_9BILA